MKNYETAYRCADKIWRLRAQKFLSGTDSNTRPLEAWEIDEVKRIAMIIRAEFQIVLPENAKTAEEILSQNAPHE